MPEGMTTQQSSWGILCGFPKMRELDSLSRPQCSASLFIIHYSSLLIILIICVCTVLSFITVNFIIYTLKINLFFWGLCIDTNKKITTNLFVESLLTAEITAQHEMLRCLLTEVTLQTEQQQLYSETFSNSKLNNSEIRV